MLRGVQSLISEGGHHPTPARNVQILLKRLADHLELEFDRKFAWISENEVPSGLEVLHCMWKI